ncbi:transketolase [Schlesneria sp. DSM 10557]|uniref:transketolase n=1 Tax=Schlesneria sp. DSM 10557 TaxID=3044399 RepID=UPI0035A14111
MEPSAVTSTSASPAEARPIPTIDELQTLAKRIRSHVLGLSHQARTAHLGSSLSCVEMVVAAYWGTANPPSPNGDDAEQDCFLLSKGHAATTLYAALAMKGFFPENWLDSYAEPGSPLGEHPSPGTPGIVAATGSLGHGLPIAIGMALAARIQGRQNRIHVLMSDGECNEGSVWEGALFAPAQKLDRLTVMIDYNKWQATGRSDEVTSLSPLKEKWAAFGWRAVEVDGHNLAELVEWLNKAPDPDGRPTALIAHTLKGKGVSFMEDDNNWHYRIPTAAELERARAELQLS